MKRFILLFLALVSAQAMAADYYVSPNMNLVIPIPGVAPGPDWANDINSSLTLLDAHDHSPGKGVPITPAGMNITSSLTFNGNLITALGGNTFLVQTSDLSDGSIYVKGVDLYYRDENGNVIQITSGGGVNGSPGSISNLSSPASASYVSANGTFVWQQGVSEAANMDMATLVLRYPGSYPVPTGNYILLQVPSSISVGYSLTLPATVAGSNNALITSSSGGALTYSYVDGSTIVFSGNTIKVPTGGITATQIANNTVTASQIANGTITGTQITSDVNLAGTAVQEASQNVVVSNTNATNSLAIIRGNVSSSGSLTAGEGFSISHSSAGIYTLTWSTAFADTPAVTVSSNGTTSQDIYTPVVSPSTTGATIEFTNPSGFTNVAFSVIAAGQR